MIQIPSFLEGVYESVGLGVVLVAAVPTLLVVVGVTIGIVRKRYGHGGGAHQATR